MLSNSNFTPIKLSKNKLVVSNKSKYDIQKKELVLKNLILKSFYINCL